MTRRKNPLTKRPSPAEYAVGYGKPPVNTRFKPGQSGNPQGRPRGKRQQKLPALHEERLKTIILEEAYRSVRITEADRQVSIPMAQAIIRSLAVNAAKGNQRAQRLFTQLLSVTERDNKRLHDEWLQTAIAYKADWESELHRRQRLGITGLPEPLPHPDHVIIDMKTGGVRITGPMTKEEKPFWDQLHVLKKDNDAEIAELEQTLRDDPKHRHREMILDDLEHARKMKMLINRVLPD